MSRRVAAETLFANMMALFMIALMATGCGIQSTKAERPDWSLNGPNRPAPQPKQQNEASKRYGDWNGPGAPKPLMENVQR
ncbi:MAG: hypothetical protein ABL893_20745 [Hyphomicrobium sp.]